MHPLLFILIVVGSAVVLAAYGRMMKGRKQDQRNLWKFPLRKAAFFLMLVPATLLVACSTSFSVSHAKEVSPQFLSSNYSTTTVNHIVYVGSDSDFHYFFHSQLMGGDSYKVEKKLMRLPHEFTLSSGHEPVLLVGRFDEISGSWIAPHLSPK